MAKTVKQVFGRDDAKPGAIIKSALSKANNGDLKSLKIKMKFGKNSDKDDKPKKKAVKKTSNWKY